MSSSGLGLEMARLSPNVPLGGGWKGEEMVQGMIDLNTLAQICAFPRTCGKLEQPGNSVSQSWGLKSRIFIWSDKRC